MPDSAPGGQTPDWRLIERVVAGGASPGDRAALEAWIGEDAGRRQTVARLAGAAQAVGTRRPRYDSARAWTVVAHQMRRPRRARPLRVARRLLAASVCVGALGLSWWTQTHRRAQLVTTARGQRATIRLGDGSRVVLAPDSRLVEAVGFGTATREVTLDGEAYFDVVHDASKPFTVVVAGARIHDIGTEFAVDAYGRRAGHDTGATAGRTQVAVAVGAVRIDAMRSSPGASIPHGAAPLPSSATVTAGQLARVDAQGRTTLVLGADIARYISWTSGDLVFDDVPLGEALPALERWYDVEIGVTDPTLTSRRITATFHDEPLPQVLAALGLVLHASYHWSGRAVTLTATGRPTATPAAP